MNKKFFLSFTAVLLGAATSALAYTDLENYKPTLDSSSSILDSAYDLFFEKTTEADSQFYTYEKNGLGELNKVYYKYTYDVKLGVVNSSVEQVGSGDVTGYFTNLERSYGLANMGQVGTITADFVGNHVEYSALINQNTQARIEKIKGDFIGNTITDTGQVLGGSAISNTQYIGNIEGNFIGNNTTTVDKTGAVWGGAIRNTGETANIVSIKGDFINNYVYANKATSEARGGAIFNNYDSEIGNITGDFIGNYAYAKDQSAYGGAIANFQHGANIKSIDGNFIGNYAFGDTGWRALGGAIYNDDSTIERISGDFIGNYVKGARVVGAAIYNQSGTITIATTENKKEILFENNKLFKGSQTASLNSIDFGSTNATVNFHAISDSVINVRDPMRSMQNNETLIDNNGGIINKTGAGSLALWGNNSEYTGQLNIKEGSLYALFDEVQDIDNDLLGQRLNFNLNNAQIVFENGTSFRPLITDTKAAFLPSNAILNDNVFLVPYAISSNAIGKYTYNYDYSKFTGWDNALAKVDTSNGEVNVEIKRDLKGYKNLTEVADTYRMRTDLSLSEREMFDNIYYTGQISKDIEEKFAVIAGRDNMIYNEVHRSGVRQFGRQIASRTQNKNCPSCGMTEGYSDEHFWFNYGQNWINRDSHGSSLGYKYSPTSLAFGYDYDVIPSALNVGIAASYGFGDVKGKGASIYNTAEVDEYLVSLYWKYKPLRAYTTGSLGGGLMTNKTKVQSTTVNTRGDYDTKAFFANAEFGYDFGNACGVIEPFVGVEYAYFYNDSYTEQGTGARHFDKMSWNSVEIPVGLRFSRNIYTSSYIITPAIEMAYARSVGDVSSKANVFFVGNPSTPWTFRGDATSRDSLRSALNLKINNLDTPFAFNFGYARDTSSGYSDDQLYLTVRYNF